MGEDMKGSCATQNWNLSQEYATHPKDLVPLPCLSLVALFLGLLNMDLLYELLGKLLVALLAHRGARLMCAKDPSA